MTVDLAAGLAAGLTAGRLLTRAIRCNFALVLSHINLPTSSLSLSLAVCRFSLSSLMTVNDVASDSKHDARFFFLGVGKVATRLELLHAL